MEEFKDNEGIVWNSYSEKTQSPKYNPPYSGQYIHKKLIRKFDKGDLSIVYVPLSFYGYPIWPKKKRHCLKSWRSLLWYYCPKCCVKLKGKARLVIELIAGNILNDINNIGFCWTSRLLCFKCCKNTIQERISFYPYILISRNEIAKELQPAIDTFIKSFSRFPPRNICYMCEKPLKNRARKNTLPLCESSEICKKSYEFIKKLDKLGKYKNNSLPKTFSIEIIVLFINYLRIKNINISKDLVWKKCHRNGCFNDARHQNLYCTNCFRVIYCSRRCLRLSRHTHLQGCVSWKKLWDLEKIII